MSRLAIQTVGAGIDLLHGCRAWGRADAKTRSAPRDLRYQIGVMERILEEAVQHGADKTTRRIQSVLPPAATCSSSLSAQVRGFPSRRIQSVLRRQKC